MNRILTLLLAAGCWLAPAASRADPLLLELFTSQSCSSCPPADALLTELAQRPGVLALDMHIDYWNGIGWHDPYSFAALTQRQSRYASLLGQGEVYTPELVVGGRSGVVGSDRAAVESAIATAASQAAANPGIGLQLQQTGTGLAVAVGTGSGAATLWLVGYDPMRTTRIGGGENGGRTLTETNIVRSLTAVAHWSGAPLQLALALPVGERTAAFLQTDNGHVIAVTKAGR